MSDTSKNKKVDPGWNDPPTLNYSPSNPPPKSRIGNKRIAFPLSSQSNSPQSSTASLLKQVVNAESSESSDKLEMWNSVAKLQEVISHVETLLARMSSQSDVMREKIDVMKAMWEENKFSVRVENLVVNMSKWLVEGNTVKANECQLQLMMESSAVCDPWIIVFRQLIQDSVKI